MNAQPWLGARAALWLMGLAVAGLGAITLFSALDRPRQSVLETTVERTAVGDRAFYKLPPAPAPAPGTAAGTSPATATAAVAVAMFEGKPLFLAAGGSVEIRDSKMVRAGTVVGGGLILYRRSPAGPQADETAAAAARAAQPAPADDRLFLKTGINRFVPLQR